MILDLFNESSIFDIDDNAINESLEPEIANAVATPIKEGENITDAYYRITLENVQNFNNIMNTVALKEMEYMEKENTDTVAYEAVDVKKFGHTIVEYVKSAWSKIKGLFEKAIESIKNIFGVEVEKQYQQAVKDGKINPSTLVTVKKGIKIEGPALTNVSSRVCNVISECMSDLLVDVNGMSAEEAKNKAVEWKTDKAAKLNNMRGQVVGAFGGNSQSCSSKDFGKRLTEAVASKIEGETKIKIGDAYSRLKLDDTVKDIRKGFKDVEKSFNEFMKEAKKIEKDAKKEKAEAAMTIGAMNVNVIKESITVLNASSHQFIKIASKRASMYRAVLTAGMRQSKKDQKEKDNKKEKAANESADLICDLI